MNAIQNDVRLTGADWLIAALLIAVVFSYEFQLTLMWSRGGLFASHNVIFDSDPDYWIQRFAHVWSNFDLWIDINHPLLQLMFSLPAHLLSTVAALLGFGTDPIELRETYALSISPLFAALKGACLYLMFRLLKLPRPEAVLATGFGVLAFSSVVFGAVPESYAITAFSMALLALLAVSAHHTSSRSIKTLGLMAGILSIGTTISNVIHYGWMMWVGNVTHARDALPKFVRAVLVSGVLLLFILTAALGLKVIVGADYSSESVKSYGDVFKKFTGDETRTLQHLLRFPETLTRTFIPTEPAFAENQWAAFKQHDIQLELSYNSLEFTAGSVLLGVLAIVLLMSGLIIAWREGGIWRWLGLGSAGSLACFGILYSWFGLNNYLYSQHWLVSGLVIASAWLRRPAMQTGIARGLLTLGLVAIALGNLSVLKVINQTLAG